MKKLLHFTADWCNPCKRIKPLIDTYISDNPDIEYIAVDVDNNSTVAKQYEVLSIPTLIAVIDDVIISRHTGVATMNQIESLFDNTTQEVVE